MLWNVVKTIVFLVVLWSVFLFALPIGISIVEIELGIQRFPSPPLVAGPLLFLCTIVALWAALTMAVEGAGTPLPVDPARELVVSGPYAFVRHPFAMAFVGQVLALGIALGSVPVIGYAAALFAVWYYGIRPGEERTLEDRFGDHARLYRRHVRGLRPRLTPYRPGRM